MKIKKLSKYFDNVDNVSYGIDYLRLNLKYELDDTSKILNKLDDDNSNMEIKVAGGFTFTLLKTRTRQGYALTVSVSIDNVSYGLWQYMEYSIGVRKTIKSSGHLVFYSTYFRLLEMGLLDQSIENEFFGEDMKFLRKSSITRVDYRLDFFYSKEVDIIKMEDVVDFRSDAQNIKYFVDEKSYNNHMKILFNNYQEGKKINYNIKSFYNKGDFQNGWTVGNKRNKSLFIRCYEKLIDSLSKGKVKLYDDYFLYKNVFRLEVEFLNKFNKRENGIPFLYADISELEEKIRRFLGLSNNVFNEKFVYQYKSNDITKFDKFRRQKEFTGRGYTLYKKGFNPFISLYNNLSEKIESEPFEEMIVEFSNHVYKKTVSTGEVFSMKF